VRARRQLPELDLAPLEVDAGDRVLVDRDVRLLVEEVAQRMADGRRLEQVRRHLVEERLERVVVVPVDDDGVDVGALELARSADPGEAAAENQHAWALVDRVGCQGLLASSRRRRAYARRNRTALPSAGDSRARP